MSFRYPYPVETKELEDVRSAIIKYILPGFIPTEPLFPRSAKIMTLGSCFAETIHEALEKAGINSKHLLVGETLNTPPFTLMTIQRLRGEETAHIGHLGPHTHLDKDKVEELRAYLPSASAFILTLGVALQPFHEDGLPMFHFTKSMFGNKKQFILTSNAWRMLSAKEVLNYTRSIIDGIRHLSPDIPVILTLSPIPLANSITHPAVMVQDCISKSTIRVAIAMLMDENIPNVFYWPSFEIVRWLGGHVGPFFGTDGTDQRHVSPQCIDLITDLFVEYYFKPQE